ncbi:hypothetical protein [uncultured Desulfovibrio sp.]|uniref:tetratricopeptide repeat protein n=1 Tax=uncultured Desulfovibrio sp. TaxID=167968 RepID=UPI00261ED834|nr:hypothetical protein [uncultured Desulfovibrio sp.]
MKFVCLLLAAVLLLALSGYAVAMSYMSRDREISPPPPSNRFMSFLDKHGFAPSWECTRMADHLPPLPPEADKIFKAARALEKRGNLTLREKGEVFNGYKKAAEMGHWKAMNNLIACYMSTSAGFGEALEVSARLISMNVGSGWYARYLLYKKTLPDLANEYLHKAADLGDPNAQYTLGYYYLYPKNQDIRGLRYLVCATRQGHGQAAYEIGIYLKMFNSYYKAMEYFYRALSLGHDMAALELANVFHPNYKPDDVIHTLGFLASSPPFCTYSETFRKFWYEMRDNPGMRFPDLFKKYPLPPNIVTTREQSRAMPSKLKDAFGGKWPDEIYPDLAPDYLPPKF